MSGEESLAQVNREIASPKLRNLKRAALIIAIFSFVFTGIGSLLAVMIIPDEVRVPLYKDNLISGMAMYMVGPHILKAGIPRLCGGGRFSDSFRRYQHIHHRLQWRVKPRF